MGTRETARRREGRRIALHADVRLLIGGLLLGAGLMYLLDPREWRRRIALSDLVGHALPQSRDGRISKVSHAPEASAEYGSAADETLARRVRVEVERVAAHPEAIEVSAVNGVVALAGTIPIAELKPLLRRVADVRGIELIENRLEVIEAPLPPTRRN
jgi:hypothetical protein